MEWIDQGLPCVKIYAIRRWHVEIVMAPLIVIVVVMQDNIANNNAQHSNVQLTQEANELIADYYTELRASSGDRALPVTVRTLETIVRLSSAHAKCRLSSKVERQDVEAAREILDAVMASSNGQAVGAQGWERRPKKGAKRVAGEDNEGDADDEVMEDEGPAADQEMADAEQGA